MDDFRILAEATLRLIGLIAIGFGLLAAVTFVYVCAFDNQPKSGHR